MKTIPINIRRLSGLLAGAALLAFTSASWAQVGPYEQDFEGLDQASPTALGDDGWQVFGNVFSPDGTAYLYGYGPFPAPNGGSAFAGIALSEGGPDQGDQVLSAYNDYDNADHNIGNRIDALIFQEQTITAENAGQTYVLTFDAKKGGIAGDTTAIAFVKTLDPNAGFATTQDNYIDTTSLPTDWETFSISITIGSNQAGQLLQFGFSNTASNFDPSNNFYDNIRFELDESGTLQNYAQDFETLDQTGESALGDDGWLAFANVFSPDGMTYLYGYGPFPAPNGSGGFSDIALNEGGEDQGVQQLNVFSDYLNADHNIGNRIESNVFQERTITGADVGKTWTFTYDAKMANIELASTAIAFIKTLDPSAGFATTNLIAEDMTAVPDTWGSFELSLTIDASLPGQLLQFGFANNASNFEGSGVYYDNVVMATPGDTDEDGVTDDMDNCIERSNADQADSNGDGYGNACDADTSQDCSVNFVDLGAFKAVFSAGPAGYDADYDFAGVEPGSPPDGFVNFIDLGRMKETFFNQGANAGPGPSACGSGCSAGICTP